MKIAAVSEDGVTISQHFGRAPFYVVVTVEGGRVLGRERRDKPGHGSQTHSHASGGHDHGEPGHGFDPAAQSRHASMAQVIADCAVVLARGMGAGAYESLKGAGIRPIVTDIEVIDEAVQAVVAGEIVDHRDRLH
jgi:predicted Fe-Mo cluster-binding NifX family protein